MAALLKMLHRRPSFLSLMQRPLPLVSNSHDVPSIISKPSSSTSQSVLGLRRFSPVPLFLRRRHLPLRVVPYNNDTQSTLSVLGIRHFSSPIPGFSSPVPETGSYSPSVLQNLISKVDIRQGPSAVSVYTLDDGFIEHGSGVIINGKYVLYSGPRSGRGIVGGREA